MTFISSNPPAADLNNDYYKCFFGKASVHKASFIWAIVQIFIGLFVILISGMIEQPVYGWFGIVHVITALLFVIGNLSKKWYLYAIELIILTATLIAVIVVSVKFLFIGSWFAFGQTDNLHKYVDVSHKAHAAHYRAHFAWTFLSLGLLHSIYAVVSGYMIKVITRDLQFIVMHESFEYCA